MAPSAFALYAELSKELKISELIHQLAYNWSASFGHLWLDALRFLGVEFPRGPSVLDGLTFPIFLLALCVRSILVDESSGFGIIYLDAKTSPRGAFLEFARSISYVAALIAYVCLVQANTYKETSDMSGVLDLLALGVQALLFFLPIWLVLSCAIYVFSGHASALRFLFPRWVDRIIGEIGVSPDMTFVTFVTISTLMGFVFMVVFVAPDEAAMNTTMDMNLLYLMSVAVVAPCLSLGAVPAVNIRIARSVITFLLWIFLVDVTLRLTEPIGQYLTGLATNSQ